MIQLVAVVFLLFSVVEAQYSNKNRKIGVIGVVNGEWNPDKEVRIYPNQPYSFTIYGQDLPPSGYALSSRSSCYGFNKANASNVVDIPLTVIWPTTMNNLDPALRIKRRFVIFRAKDGIPFKTDSLERFRICHPEIQGNSTDYLMIRSAVNRSDWWKCIAMLGCLIGSGFCSGVSIAFFTYSTDELLSIIEASINQTEKHYAEEILWYRQKSNYLICCFASSNCIFNVLLTNLCEQIFENSQQKAVISLLVSCCLTVILGEILPQTICSRYGLVVAAKTRYATLFLFLLMAPFAWPLSKLIDLILGREAREVLSRDQLKKLLTHHANNLSERPGDQEGEILRRTVKFQDMTIRDIMKPLSDVFALSDACKFTPELALNLVERGSYSRIPVFSGRNTKNIYGCINMSDLLSKPKQGQTIAQIMQETTSHLRFAPIDMKLPALSEEMKTGEHHMCAVFDYRFNKNEIRGLVTSEDVWEQLFGDIQDDLDLAFGNKRTGIRKDQATLDWYKEKGLPFNCNRQLAIIQQLYNLCPELKWMGLNVHKMRNFMPQKLKTLAALEELICDMDKIYVICRGEFEAEIMNHSDCSSSDTKASKRFTCKNGRVFILNSNLSSLVAQEYVKGFPSFQAKAPYFAGKYELKESRIIHTRRETSYFTIDREHLIQVIRSQVEDEGHEHYESHRQAPPFSRPPSRNPRTRKIGSNEDSEEHEPLLKVKSTQADSEDDLSETSTLHSMMTQRSSLSKVSPTNEKSTK